VIGLGMFIKHNKQSPAIEQIVEVNNADLLFGFDTNKFHFETHSLKRNQNLGDLLVWQGAKWDSILKLDKVSKKFFSIRNFRANRPFTVVKQDSCASPICIVYEPNKYTYIKYFLDDINIDVVKRDYETCVETASGVIKSSLWLAMQDVGLSGTVIDKMEDALASSVDFYHTQKGDKFKLIYERRYLEGKPIGYGAIISAAFKNQSGEHFAVFYANDRYRGFYDLEGRPTKSTFLRAPLKYSRISSGYNPRRFHPIKKRRIPHLGTDYAAPIGTPIYAVADGVVTVASFTRNNGKFVKIKHDDVYQTQYLHMFKFAKAIRKGARVYQGQIIGQVGMSGLATGPHVCYRFWKHGKQVNHLRENFPPKDPLPEEELPNFYQQRDSLVNILKEIPYKDELDQLSMVEH